MSLVTSPTIQPIADSRAFLDRTLPLRRLDPIGTNKIASIAVGVATRAQPSDCHRFYVVAANDAHDSTEDAKVTSFALYNHSSGLLLSPTMSREEAAALGKLVANSIDHLVEEVRGITAATLAFIDSYCRHRSTPTTAELKHDLLLYALHNLRPPPSDKVRGTMRVASVERDVDMLTTWAAAFFAYMGSDQEASSFVTSRLKRRSMFVWEVEGKSVGFASFAPPVDVEGETVYRIGSVFISPTERRKGYASGLTAALSQHLQETNTSRSSRICLFADAANPASNKAYQTWDLKSKANISCTSLQRRQPPISC